MWKFKSIVLISVLGLALFVATANAKEQMSNNRDRDLGDSVDTLIQQLKGEDPHSRMLAADALGQIKDVRAVKPLIAVLEDENSSGRTQTLVAGALVRIGAPAVEPLIAALKDENPLVRMQAAGALGQIKDIRAVDPLVGALKDENPIVRMQAADSLGKIRDMRAVEPLTEALKDNDSLVRERVADSLGQIKNMRAEGP